MITLSAKPYQIVDGCVEEGVCDALLPYAKDISQIGLEENENKIIGEVAAAVMKRIDAAVDWPRSAGIAFGRPGCNENEFGVAVVKLAFNLRPFVEYAVFSGSDYGLMRTFKHTDSPEFDQASEQISGRIMDRICEIVDFDRSGNAGGKIQDDE